MIQLRPEVDGRPGRFVYDGQNGTYRVTLNTAALMRGKTHLWDLFVPGNEIPIECMDTQAAVSVIEKFELVHSSYFKLV